MQTKRASAVLIFSVLIISLTLLLAVPNAYQVVHAATTWSVTVERWDSPNSLTAPTNAPTQSLLVDDIGDPANATIQAVSGYGGFYQQNKAQTAYANYTGVPVSYFASIIGINANYAIIVKGVGSNEFDYNLIMNNQADVNNTWDSNAVENAPPQNNVCVILAYLANGESIDTYLGDTEALRTLSVNPIQGQPGLAILGAGGKTAYEVDIIYQGTGTPFGTQPSDAHFFADSDSHADNFAIPVADTVTDGKRQLA